MLQCGICHEAEVDHIGLLDTRCNHCFHYDCIVEWSKRQTWCPFCRRTFTTITHKALDLQHLPIDSAPDVGLIDLDALPGTLVEEPLVVEPKTQDDLRQLLLQEDEDVGRGWTVGDDDDEQEEDDQYASLVCDVCDQGNDEALMLLCDECDQGFHTYCVGLQSIPQGHWYCDHCRELRHIRQERLRQTSTHRQSRSNRPHTRSRGNDGFDDDLVEFLHRQVEQAINRSTSRAQRAAARAPERRRVTAIQDNWQDLRQGTATFQQQLEPRSPPTSTTQPPTSTPRTRRTPTSRMTRRRLRRQIRVTAARAARARSVRSGRPPPSDPSQQAARARAAELLRQQREGQQGGTSGSGPVSTQPQQPLGSKRARDSDEDDDVPLSQQRVVRPSLTPTVPSPPAQPSQPSQRLQQLYNRMGVRGPVQDRSDARLAALARGRAAPPPPNPHQ